MVCDGTCSIDFSRRIWTIIIYLNTRWFKNLFSFSIDQELDKYKTLLFICSFVIICIQIIYILQCEADKNCTTPPPPMLNALWVTWPLLPFPNNGKLTTIVAFELNPPAAKRTHMSLTDSLPYGHICLFEGTNIGNYHYLMMSYYYKTSMTL